MNTSPTTDDLLAGVRKLCAALPEVTEGLTHGAPTWFVRGRRSFAKFIDPERHRFDELHVAFWVAAPPGARHELVAADPSRFFVPPFGGHDWVGMRLDAEPDGLDWTKFARSSPTPTARLPQRPLSPDWIPHSDAELSLARLAMVLG